MGGTKLFVSKRGAERSRWKKAKAKEGSAGISVKEI